MAGVFAITTRALAALVAAYALAAASSSGFAQSDETQNSLNACAEQSPGAIGVSRIVEIDTGTGALFGAITRREKEPRFLAPKEVVLTFDDGPVPWITGPILRTLEAHCTKATFFYVGKMALAYPDTLKAVKDAGHTVAGHTWSHPLNLRRLSHDKAVSQIEKGFSAIEKVIPGQVTPFFRFPGLNDSNKLLSYLQKRRIASFSVDVVSDDSFINDPDKLVALTMQRVRARQGGIVLFHDIKPATAKALPQILAKLKAEGYAIVHLRSREFFEPSASHPAPELEAKDLATRTVSLTAGDEPHRPSGAGAGAKNSSHEHDIDRKKLVPFFGALALKQALDPAVTGLPVSVLEPPLRYRTEADRKAAEARRRAEEARRPPEWAHGGLGALRGGAVPDEAGTETGARADGQASSAGDGVSPDQVLSGAERREPAQTQPDTMSPAPRS